LRSLGPMSSILVYDEFPCPDFCVAWSGRVGRQIEFARAARQAFGIMRSSFVKTGKRRNSILFVGYDAHESFDLEVTIESTCAR